MGMVSGVMVVRMLRGQLALMVIVIMPMIQVQVCVQDYVQVLLGVKTEHRCANRGD